MAEQTEKVMQTSNWLDIKAKAFRKNRMWNEWMFRRVQTKTRTKTKPHALTKKFSWKIYWHSNQELNLSWELLKPSKSGSLHLDTRVYVFGIEKLQAKEKKSSFQKKKNSDSTYCRNTYIYSVTDNERKKWWREIYLFQKVLKCAFVW